MNGKDPAVLFFISDWLVSTNEMEADCRGWYLNLILNHYDKGSLPNDIEKLATLANVKFSEFKKFEQVFEQVLKQKFKLNEDGRLINENVSSILRGRESFKDERSKAGKKSYLMRFFRKEYPNNLSNNGLIEFISENIDLEINTKNEQVIKHMFEHLFELYRNRNRNIDDISNDEEYIETEVYNLDVYCFEDFWNDYDKKVGEKKKIEKKYNKLSDSEKLKIKDYIPLYKNSQPNKQYRKNPETFLNNKSWNDEIISNLPQNNTQQKGVPMANALNMFMK